MDRNCVRHGAGHGGSRANKMGQASRGLAVCGGLERGPAGRAAEGLPGSALRSCQRCQVGPVTDSPAPSTRQPLTFKSEDKVCEGDYSEICLYKCEPHLTKDERPPDNCTPRQGSSRALHAGVLPGAVAPPVPRGCCPWLCASALRRAGPFPPRTALWD